MSVMLKAALRYADLGYRVFPCRPGTKKPRTESGFHDATTDAEQIERWWTARPNSNIGIATEGLLVLDIDANDNSWLADDPEKMLELACGPLSITADGGHHELWMSVGGSAGHSGLWGLNIDEGTRQDANGRRWEVEVISAAEAFAERAEAAQDAAGLSSFANDPAAQKLKSGQGNAAFDIARRLPLRGGAGTKVGNTHHHQRFDVGRHPEKAKATHRKMRPKDRPLENDFVSDEEFDELLLAWFGNIARVLRHSRFESAEEFPVEWESSTQKP